MPGGRGGLTTLKSAARIDFSWGGPAYHRETLDNLNRAMQNTNQTCAVIMDTKGPEIVISLPEEGAKVPLQKGSRIKLTSDPGGWVSPQAGAMTTLPVQFPDLGRLEAGTEVFVGQYLVSGAGEGLRGGSLGALVVPVRPRRLTMTTVASPPRSSRGWSAARRSSPSRARARRRVA